jgi:two-component system heavy metal sensor histidine kinase CusS
MMRAVRPSKPSLTRLLTLSFTLVTTVILLLLGVMVSNSVEHHFEEEDVEMMRGKLELTRRVLERADSTQALAALPRQIEDALHGHHGLAIAVMAADGRRLFVTGAAEFPVTMFSLPQDASISLPQVWHTAAGLPFRGIAARVHAAQAGPAPWVIAVATDISHHERFLHAFRVTLWGVLVLAALACGLLGWLVVRRALVPLHAIRHEAAAITADRLHARLDVQAVPAELVELADTLNQMLSRLEDSFRRLSEYSSDIAHELRTPISNLLTQTQVTLARPRDVEAYQDVLASNVEELERMAKMVADMLFLAKTDNDMGVGADEQVDLRHEVDSLVAFYEAVAEDNGVVLAVEGAATAPGDRLMLRRAIGNLLSNALAHTPRGGQIRLHLEMHDGAVDGHGPVFGPVHGQRVQQARVSVENTGQTIAAEHLPRLFDRFYRADPSRKRQGEGVGLGLAITRSIARAHGGEVTVHSTAGVTVFELSIPVDRDAVG